MKPVGRARSIRLRFDQDPRLKKRAEELGRAEADIVREALDGKMAREGW